MRAKTKEQVKVLGWSKTLPAITKAQEQWSIKAELEQYVYVLKKELCCFTCGHRWPNNDKIGLDNRKCVCPSCGAKLIVPTFKKYDYVGGKQKTVEVLDRTWSGRQEGYTTIVTTCNGYQVFRHLYVSCYMHRHEPRSTYIKEVVQDWLSPEGKHTIVAHQLNSGMFGSGPSWTYGEMDIKVNYDKYSINGDVYPRQNYIPAFERFRKLKVEKHSLVSKMILLSDYRMESIWKSGYKDLFNHFVNGNRNVNTKELDMYWPAIKICQRNNYSMDDQTYVWLDHVRDLINDKKDIRNSHYVCPPDLRAAHQVYINRKQKEHERLTEMKLLEKIDEYNSSYHKHVERFKELTINDDELVIKPLLDVYDFYLEGKAMHHCVFSGEYFKKDRSLILSARKGDQRLETIQVSIEDFTVKQAHGLCNKDSEHHKQIIDLVRRNMGTIAKLAKPKRSKIAV